MAVLTQHNFTGSAGADIDTFAFSDGTTYTLWRYQTSGQTVEINGAGTRARGTNASGEATYTSDDAPGSANQYAEIVVFAVTSNTGAIGILLRAASGADQAYWFAFDAGSGNWTIYRHNTSFTALDTDTFATTGGNSYTIRAESRGPNHRLLLDGSAIATVTDSAITAANLIGIYSGGAGGSIGLEITSIETGTIDPIDGTMAMILPQLSMAMSGTVSSGADVTGTMAMSLPQLNMAMSGLVLGPTEYIDTAVDARHIESMSGVTGAILTPSKSGSNPIAPPVGSNLYTWDFDQYYGAVLQSAGVVKYWYGTGDTTGAVVGSAYATIESGALVKPNLGLVTFGGNTNNNLFIGGELYGPQVREYPENDPSERYVMVSGRHEEENGVYVFVSADGINFTLAKAVYVATGSFVGYREGHELDRLEDGRYVAVYSTGHGDDERVLGRFISDSDDLTGTWTDDGLMGGVDTAVSTAQWYSMAIHIVDRHTRLGFVERYNSTTGKITVDLFTSHDEGANWTLLDADWLPVGSSSAWDDEMITPLHDMIRSGNVWNLYYQGYPIGHAGPAPYDGRLGVSTLGYGRVASITGTGPVKERAALAPLRYLLTANGTGGTITAELLNPATGIAISGFATTDFDDITTDVTEHSLTWSGQTPPAGTPVQLVIHLDDATRYQLQATDAITGTMSLTLPQLQMSMSGIASTAIDGEMAMALPQLSMSMSGTVVTPGAVTGTLAMALPQLQMAMTGTASSTITGTMAMVLPQLTISMSGSIAGEVDGTMAIVLPQLRMSMSGTVDTLLDTCIITAQLHDLGGADVAGVTALLIIEQTPQDVDDSYIIAGMATATSDSNGLITFPPVLRGARVLIRINEVGYLKEVIVPDAATLQL